MCESIRCSTTFQFGDRPSLVKCHQQVIGIVILISTDLIMLADNHSEQRGKIRAKQGCLPV